MDRYEEAFRALDDDELDLAVDAKLAPLLRREEAASFDAAPRLERPASAA